MRVLVRWLLAFLLIFVVLLSGLAALLLSADTKVTQVAAQQVESADSARELIGIAKRVLERQQQSQRITISQAQLNSLFGLVTRARPEFKVQALLTTQGLALTVSYQVPKNWFGQYLNVSTVVLPGQGLTLQPAELGSLSISGQSTLELLAWAVNRYTRSDLGDATLEQVQELTMSDQAMTITLEPINAYLVKLNRVKNQFSHDDNEVLSEYTLDYVKHLSVLAKGQNRNQQSLAWFIHHLFQQVTINARPYNAAVHNQAAIIALAIFTGDHRFAHFSGIAMAKVKQLNSLPYPPTLAKRRDLALHFIFSAAIEVLSTQGISSAVGEFKELVDRGRGGSGFSFVDLAADLAGVNFAQIASNPATARQLAQVLATKSGEAVLFPQATDLPEGLSKAQFTRYFGSVDSQAYLALLSKINRRIAELEISQIQRH
ncbi:hypothetical protein J7384_06280 [Endozoicomonas sp. G2_1]|uniref:hypothetical protein n=1 Tax=Endozoicomonas sp. G2_1 TaxID=2821091 RepID=UPI001ADC1DE6|nr:hypothetical protein [Endozoicomonas sp. G2_1]MBO9489964.1 hypothetical protein [Endozoicomonas sp. G2_1]